MTDVNDLIAQKKEIETLLKSLEDEYGRAQISDNTYNEIKSKNLEKLKKIEEEIQKLGGSENSEQPQEQPPQPTPPSQSIPQPVQPTPQQKAAPADAAKLKSEIMLELGKKIDTEINKINIELEKIKAFLDAQKDLRTATDEKLQRLTEGIGELRSMLFQKESEIDKMNVKVQKIEEVFNDVRPEQYSRELQKRDKELANQNLRIEKLEKVSYDMVKDVNEIKTLFKEIGSVENLVNVSKRINEKFIKMENMLKDVEKISEKLEKHFVEINKKLEEFEEYKNKQMQIDGLSKDLLKAVDDINVKIGKLASEEELFKLKEIVNSFTKDLEDVKKSVASGLPFLGPLPEEVQQLQKQKDEIKTLLSSIDEQYKARALKEEEYKRIREANLQKLADIDAKIRESIERLKGIPAVQPTQAVVAQPEVQSIQQPVQPEEDKATKLLSELKDLYKKGLISEKAYQKTTKLLLK
jgi:chromosome segregation ATPase